MLNRDDVLSGLNSLTLVDDGLESSLDSASKFDPDRHVEIKKLSESSNLPIDTVDRQMDEVKRRGLLSAIDVNTLRRDNPSTAKWLSNKNNSAIAIDDIDILKGMDDKTSAHNRTWGEFGTDTAIDAGKGIVGLGEAAVGIADILTFNMVGDSLESIGYSPEETKQLFGKHYSLSRSNSDRKVANAKGFFDTLGALATNPDAAFGTIVESAPLMIAGAAAVRAVASKMLAAEGIAVGSTAAAAFLSRPAIIAKLTSVSAASEGAMAAGSIQEQARQKGRTWLESVLPAVAGGVGTGLIGKLSSKILPDVEVGAATASLGKGTRPEILSAGKEVAKGIFKEGALEELPQSGQEQVFTNLAMGNEWSEGVEEAMAQGLVAGAGMGGGMSFGAQAMSLMNGSERQVKTAIATVSEQAYIDQVITYAQTSKTNERASSQFAEFVNSLGGEREVLIPNDIAMELEDAPGYLIAQVNVEGIDISVPLDKFASDIAVNEEWMNIIRPHIKLSPNTLTQTELNDSERGELQELMKKAAVEKETLTEADRIFETVKDQIKATGMQGESTARHSAQLYPAAAAVYVEKARKAGHDVSLNEVFEMFGFRVESGDVETKPRGDIIYDQDSIPDDLEIEMDVETVETGETGAEKFNAKELNNEINGKLDAYKNLMDCLA